LQEKNVNRSQLRLGVILLALIVMGVLWFLRNSTEPPEPPGGQPGPGPQGDQETGGYPHLRWGNPSGARADLGDKNNYLMEKKNYALSYNNSKGTPNWVSWRVVKEDLGDAPRFPFVPDPDLPPGFKTITTQDYVESGFDRGHMCPHADRQSDEEASKATFLMTNIVPQSSANNEKGWEQFESYCRTLVSRQGKELYIVCGPFGEGGQTRRKEFVPILHSKDGDITVPAKTWKVVMVLDRGGKPDRNTRLLAVVMPNDESVGEDWGPYRTSVQAVEAMTHYTFFDRADLAIGPLKGQVDSAPVPPPHDHGR
jgi:endonuclease G, mitochondrial